MIKSTPMKESIYAGFAHSFRDLVHYHHSGEHHSIQAEMMMETKLKVLHPDLQAAGREREQH